MLVGMMGGIDAVIMFMAGLVATLYGSRRIGKRPGADPVYDARFARVRPVFLIGGPLTMIVAVALPLLEPSAPSPPPEWQSVTTSDGVCRIEMPGTPSPEGGTLILEGLGKPETQQLKLLQENGQVWYTMSHSPTHDVLTEMPAEKVLDGIQKDILLLAERLGAARLVSERDLSEQGYPGKELVIDIDDSATQKNLRMQSKWFLIHKRLYRAIAMTPRDDKHLRDASRFLESFRIVEKPDADKGS